MQCARVESALAWQYGIVEEKRDRKVGRFTARVGSTKGVACGRRLDKREEAGRPAFFGLLQFCLLLLVLF